MTSAVVRPGRDIGDVLAFGFGTALAMWVVGYFGRLPNVHAPAALLFAAFIGVLLAGGWIAGRTSPRGWKAGLCGGAIAGAINLLILGSVVGGKQGLALPSEILRAAAIWGPTCIGISALLGAAGAMLARLGRATRRSESTPTPQPWAFWFAGVAAAATLVLLPLGGAVTGFEAGLAVPDWPSSFGYNMFLFPLAKMTGGIYFEHSHRLFGSFVGLTTLSLAIYLLIVERRRWVRVLGCSALVMVIVQGVMGALRVTEINLLLAVIHGVFGQVFFATIVCLAAFLSSAWKDRSPRSSIRSASGDRNLAYAAVGILVLQLAFGALLRHFNWGLHLHLTMAGIAFIAIGMLSVRTWSLYETVPIVSRSGLAVLWILLIQILLGFAALIAVWGETPGAAPRPMQVLITTIHQTTGAILLATTTLLTAWHMRLVAASRQSAGDSAQPVLREQAG